jgi:hypothetical protein
MKPTLGRIVHCMTADGAISPAIITRFHDDKLGPNGEEVVNVYLFKDEPSDVPERAHEIHMVAGPREAQPGTWWWPERL